MKIAYVCYWNAFVPDGVTAKISAQVAAWRAVGNDAWIFCLTPVVDRAPAQALEASLFRFRNRLERVRATTRLARAVSEYSPDIIYFRYDLFVPPLTRLLRRFRSVVEVNADIRLERTIRGAHAWLYNHWNIRAVLGVADGLVCVSHELARAHESFGVPTAVIPNGVTFAESQRPRPRPPGPARLVFSVGKPSPWHGIDKFLVLARSNADWHFDLIGVEPPAAKHAYPNVHFRGHMSGPPMAALLSRADVGIGTLALHRAGQYETSPLKLREYLSYGLPTILAYDDSDFIGLSPWYLLRLPNCESNVAESLPVIREFVERVSGMRVPRAEVEPRISWDAKEVKRLAFFDDVIRSRTASTPREASGPLV